MRESTKRAANLAKVLCSILIFALPLQVSVAAATSELQSETPGLFTVAEAKKGATQDQDGDKKPCKPESPCQPSAITPADQVGGTSCACGAACMSAGAPCNFNTGTCTLAIIGTCPGGGAKCNCVCNPNP